MMRRQALLIGGAAFAIAACLGLGGVAHAKCKKKTTGYFRQITTAAVAIPALADLEGIAESLTGTMGDPTRGRAVMAHRQKGNCLACHRVAALSDEQDHGDLGPDLNGIAERYTEAQLRQLIVDAKVFFPNTVMPAFHNTERHRRVAEPFRGKPMLTAQEVEDVVAFLKTLK